MLTRVQREGAYVLPFSCYTRKNYNNIARGTVQRLRRLYDTAEKFKCRTLHKKSSFPLRISSVNVTKSGDSCRFGRIY